MTNNYDQLIKNILNDIAVELGDEFDKNFDRQAFFSESWQRRKSPIRPGRAILVDSGNLRRSIEKPIIKERSIVFRSDEPYAAIHNEGGVITVTAKMKQFFRAKFYEAQGGFTRKSGNNYRPLTDGGFYNWTSKMSLTTEAAFWRNMALMKVGSKIRIPRRQFLGTAPEVEKTIREIIEENLTEFFNVDFDIIER